MSLQVVIPMSGAGARFVAARQTTPKPILDAGGRPMLAHLLDRFPRDARFVFIAREDHLEDGLRATLTELCPRAVIVGIAPHKEGPVHAVLAAEHAIHHAPPTIVNYCDFSFSWDVGHFQQWTRHSHADGAIITYRGARHPHFRRDRRYATCLTDPFGRVLEVREKDAFTDDPSSEPTSSGTYWFRSGQVMLDACRKHATRGRTIQGERYLSLVMDDLVRDGHLVRAYEIDTFLQWGTPEDLDDWRYWHRAFSALEAAGPTPGGPVQPADTLLMPMAGLGSRFGDASVPKPFLPVQGVPMFALACHLLPQVGRRLFLVLDAHEDATEDALPHLPAGQAEITSLDAPTDGQAATCAAASERLRATPDGPLWISSCDHGLLLAPDALDHLDRSGCDVAIVGTRGLPDARRTPTAYSWIDAHGSRDLLRVRRVHVKTPFLDPDRDPALVGTFWFRSAHAFAGLLDRLLERNERTGGERYLDPIINLAVQEGLDVRLLEAPAWFCWGTPAALDEYRYWHRWFRGFEA